MKFYKALGLEPALALDVEEVKKHFYERSRQWHPDRFSRASSEDQAKALEMTAVLNDAFRTLRDPVTRAEYVLEERGLPPAKSAPPELLEEVFELNMALDELRSGDESARGALTEARGKFRAMLAESDEALSTLFAKHDASPSEEALKEIRSTLDRRRYIANLVRDVEKELNGNTAN